ncbi:hypothetical protein YM304_21050 [Ilumatobacter coccineus YM16-304]|uniref:Uncharacterized protein n=1 Tax=Ilumatobacter coccineus (strain NBRC 103263 / KCTC 29153 / YM16-304) TaxID=1313172 RepID=A0A6C7EB38_ILUCY|nr:hypothetical protein YM304_21050 [Ilumatobacter coccineus YM16-304]
MVSGVWCVPTVDVPVMCGVGGVVHANGRRAGDVWCRGCGACQRPTSRVVSPVWCMPTVDITAY